MYCNSCLKLMKKDEITYCEQCGVPLCKGCANHCSVCGKTLCDTCYLENKYKCEDCYKPEDNFKTIRRSHLEQYAGCPYSLYLQLVEGITPPMGKHAQLGIIVHQLIDEMSEYEYTLPEIKSQLSLRIMEWNDSTDDPYSLIDFELEKTGKECLENFWLIKDSIATKKFESEKNIKFHIWDDLPQISCTLDRISWKDNGDILIHDWKTGKPMSGKKLITDLQPALYICAVYMEYDKWPKSFTLHYLHPNKHITYNFIEPFRYEVKTSRSEYMLDIDDAIQRTKDILKGIRDGKFLIPENIEWRCNSLCWFGLSGKCSGAQDEEWKAINKSRKKAGGEK